MVDRLLGVLGLAYTRVAGGGSSPLGDCLSYRQLSPEAARLFRLLPVHPGPDVSAAAAGALADWPAGVTRKVIGQLAAAHLAEPAAGVGGRWRMHDLVRVYARQVSDAHAEADGREQAYERLFAYYLEQAGAADHHLNALAGQPVPARFTGRQDALVWLDAERASLIAAVTLAASIGYDEVALRLPLCLQEYLAWRRRFDDWLAVLEISRDAAWALNDQHHEAAALTSLGLALAEVRRFDEAITVRQVGIVGRRTAEGALI